MERLRQGKLRLQGDKDILVRKTRQEKAAKACAGSISRTEGREEGHLLRGCFDQRHTMSHYSSPKNTWDMHESPYFT